ncbi:SGNH/GDSL hydrolase family protein [Prosthecobacter vanneervenii]|uniref:Lysophospholipase L1-like esterase/nicotinamidase-related amidase n=1 Tax=Prosthecobacter vanneervenii TaxID=48466 RepID=A0A7W8DJQ4_9BACT|nr:SGNH/GDSL hydrolase family protein [Prosthecobacter vanneervenii]MBB5032327.1 lysophospholipase L1-like esterase/nicotinamidase-related amidase [Prosthecobacter vanneervenii]
MKTLTLLLALSVSCLAAETPLSLTLQSRAPAGKAALVKEQWLPSRTAIIVCDMWDLHHCKNAVTREVEMAPRMNEVLEKARKDGVLIIHAPSSCMKAYEGTPARERAKSAPTAARLPDKIAEWCKQIPAEEMAVYPLDQTDGGEDDDLTEHAAWAKELAARGLNPNAPWTKQIDVLRIDQEKDAISDSGVEIWNLLEAKNIDNVILMGVHLNMCVSGRPFGLRQMAKNGKHVVLMRDLTDTMYNPARWPFVSHARGTELFVSHVEKRICPTITSDQFIGGKPFVFSDATAGKKRLQIILLGDSTTEASIPKKLAPDEPQIEDTLRIKLAAEADLPLCDVYNEGVSGEFIRRLLDTRYDKAVKTKPQADYIFIRYGLNDQAKVKDFKTQFAKDFHELLERLRKDHPKAMLIPMTVIPYALNNLHEDINALIKQIAKDEKLTLFDIAPRYLAELKKNPDGLNYRRFPLSKIPENLRPLATPYIQPGTEPTVVVLDNHLDGVFGHLPGWAGDRHPNLAGYNVIADETAKWLAPVIRSRLAVKK